MAVAPSSTGQSTSRSAATLCQILSAPPPCPPPTTPLTTSEVCTPVSKQPTGASSRPADSILPLRNHWQSNGSP